MLLGSFVLVLGLLFVVITPPNAIADPGSPIDLLATIETVADGVAPLPSIDSSTLNGDVANLDLVTHNFDFTVNTNDGNPHNGPFVIGSVNRISASWSPAVETPNNTDVDVAFTVQGVMTPDAFFPVPINPDNATSGTETITAVSEAGNIEMRKRLINTSNYTINRDGSGNPISVTIPWAVTMGLVNQNDGNAKGVNSSALGDITFDDDLSALGAPFQNAALGNCGIGVSGDNTALPIGVSPIPNPSGNRSSVKNAGTFSCLQAGGSGSLISVTNSGVDYAAEWFPFGYSNLTPAEWFGCNTA